MINFRFFIALALLVLSGAQLYASESKQELDLSSLGAPLTAQPMLTTVHSSSHRLAKDTLDEALPDEKLAEAVRRAWFNDLYNPQRGIATTWQKFQDLSKTEAYKKLYEEYPKFEQWAKEQFKEQFIKRNNITFSDELTLEKLSQLMNILNEIDEAKDLNDLRLAEKRLWEDVITGIKGTFPDIRQFIAQKRNALITSLS